MVSIPRPEVYLLRQAVFHISLLRFLAMRRRDFDVVLFHQMSAPWLIPVRLMRQALNLKLPLLVMDTRTLSMVPDQRMDIKARLRKGLYGFTEWMANMWADGRLAITGRMADSIGIPPGKLWGVWPSGVDLESVSSARARRIWPQAGEAVCLIYIGVLHRERNLMTLSRAVEQANSEGMSFRLLMAGDGTERTALEQYASGTKGRVRVVRSVPRSKVVELLAEAHVGVLPFPDEEKFRVSSPIKLFEYMGAGLAILATRVACHVDVAGGDSFVFWADTADVAGLLSALRRVWVGRDLLNSMGSRAAVAAESWTWKKSAEKLRFALEEGMRRSCSPMLEVDGIHAHR